MQVTDAGWATFCAPFAVAIPSDVKAYTAKYEYTTDNRDWIRLTEVTSIIPAATPVVLTATSYPSTTIYGVATTSETTCVDGCLVGNLGETTAVAANANNYLLQKNDGKAAWYLVDSEGFKIGQNRCYLNVERKVSNPSRVLTMGFDEATGIQSITQEAQNMKDGKYLVKGQVVVVKAGKAYNTNGNLIK